MARPRMFDEQHALDAAMHVFWSHGYEATSTEELCTATGLKRSSIYNTFHSKHELFLRALSHYLDERTAQLLEHLDSPHPLRQRLSAVLEYALTGDRVGCFAVNSAIELSPRDSEVDELLRRDRQRRVTAIAAAVEAARARGEWDGDRTPQDVGYFMHATMAGLQVVARSGARTEDLRAIADTALAAI